MRLKYFGLFVSVILVLVLFSTTACADLLDDNDLPYTDTKCASYDYDLTDVGWVAGGTCDVEWKLDVLGGIPKSVSWKISVTGGDSITVLPGGSISIPAKVNVGKTTAAMSWTDCPAEPVNSYTISVTAICKAPDADGDGVPDANDNCKNNANPNQADADNDGIGDICDAPVDDGDGGAGIVDTDKDGIEDSKDNCKAKPNPNQLDTDKDGVGDLCDNCPYKSNSNQADPDKDGIGTVCDNCPSIRNPNQGDDDKDKIGNLCDKDFTGNESTVVNYDITINPDNTDDKVDTVVNTPAAKNTFKDTLRKNWLVISISGGVILLAMIVFIFGLTSSKVE